MSRALLCYYNLLWFFSSLLNYFRFKRAGKNIAQIQTQRMLSIIAQNSSTLYGKKHDFGKIKTWEDFQKLPLTTYSDYNEYIDLIKKAETDILTSAMIEFLQPTSGTSSKPKLIPLTNSLMNDFRVSLDVWMVDLFLQYPKIFSGTQYWSISPMNEAVEINKNNIKIGFPDDWDYFGAERCSFLEKIFAVPSIVKQLKKIDHNQYVTALFLLRTENLKLISVWHPSFLTLLLDFIRSNWSELLKDIETGGIATSFNIDCKLRSKLELMLPPDKAKAEKLKNISLDSIDIFAQVWSNLQIISCWCEGNVKKELKQLQLFFPKTIIQGKGLLATEGVVTVPIGKGVGQVAALTSHVLEFIDEKGAIFPLWNLKINQIYEIVITTSGGLYRYKLTDRVQVVGSYLNIPSLRFIGRSGILSDLVGEKLHIELVENALATTLKRFNIDSKFTILVPSINEKHENHYKMLMEIPLGVQPDINKLADYLDEKLVANYHYSYARKIGQLAKPEVILIKPDATNRFRQFMINQGSLAGTVKFPALALTPGIEQFLINNN